MAAEPGLLANVQTALQAGGVADVSVSPVRHPEPPGWPQAGLPAGLVSALQQLATSDSQLQDIQLQQIQAEFVAQDPAAAAGSLSGDPDRPGLHHPGPERRPGPDGDGPPHRRPQPGQRQRCVQRRRHHTNDATPTFAGTAPAGTTVQLFAQSQVDSTPVLIGSGVTDAAGNWQITANHLADGTYAISARFSGGASGFGQVTPLTQIVIETVAPRITAASYNHKTGQVTIIFNDPAGIDPASLANPAFFVARTGKGAKSPALKISGFQSAGTQVTFTVVQGPHAPDQHLPRGRLRGCSGPGGERSRRRVHRHVPLGQRPSGQQLLDRTADPPHKATKPEAKGHSQVQGMNRVVSHCASHWSQTDSRRGVPTFHGGSQPHVLLFPLFLHRRDVADTLR